METFDFSQNELLTFFMVLVRFSVLFALLPFFGDKLVPGPLKILLSLSVTFLLFPVLISSGQVRVDDAAVWSATTFSLVRTVAIEAFYGACLGFSARLIFDSILFGGNMVGTLMGFSAASQYDHMQESQSQVIAQFLMAIAMLFFLALDGHHLLLKAALDSYRAVTIGAAEFGPKLSQTFISLTSETVRIGIQISAPVAISLFSVNVVYGVIGRAIPQLNILVLSFAVTTFVGFVVMFLSLPHFGYAVTGIYEKIPESLSKAMMAMAGR